MPPKTELEFVDEVEVLSCEGQRGERWVHRVAALSSSIVCSVTQSPGDVPVLVAYASRLLEPGTVCDLFSDVDGCPIILESADAAS